MYDVLLRLADPEYSVHFGKCEFAFSEVGSLGVVVGREGTRSTPFKVKARRDLQVPSTVGEVCVL